MPITKRRLDQREKQKHFEALSFLHAAEVEGAEIDTDECALQDTKLLIHEWGPEFHNQIFNYHGLRSGVVVGVRLLATHPGIVLTDCEIDLLWNTQFQMLMSGTPKRLGGWQLAPDLVFYRDELLNNRILDEIKLHVGEPVEGAILALGADPIPSKFHHGSRVEVRLTFAGQSGESYSTMIALRTNLRVGGKSSDLDRKGSTLYERQKFPFEEEAIFDGSAYRDRNNWHSVSSEDQSRPEV
jgi:hypothetical protein